MKTALESNICLHLQQSGQGTRLAFFGTKYAGSSVDIGTQFSLCTCCIRTNTNLNCALLLFQKLPVLIWRGYKCQWIRYFFYFSVIYCLLALWFKGAAFDCAHTHILQGGCFSKYITSKYKICNRILYCMYRAFYLTSTDKGTRLLTYIKYIWDPYICFSKRVAIFRVFSSILGCKKFL